MGFMERLGCVKKGTYEEVVRARDSLRKSVAELEDARAHKHPIGKHLCVHAVRNISQLTIPL